MSIPQLKEQIEITEEQIWTAKQANSEQFHMDILKWSSELRKLNKALYFANLENL